MTDVLLAPIDRDSPCGPNLEYDADFLLLQEYASEKSEQQYGDTLIAAELPDWTRVEQCATSLLARTKDLRVVTQLTRAWIQARGFAGWAQGLRLAAAYLETYGDAVHPELTIDGKFDPLPRVNVLHELAGESSSTRALRDSPLFAGMNARTLAGALSRNRTDAPSITGPGGPIVAELRAAHASGEPVLVSALGALDALHAVRQAVQTRLGHEWVFDASAVERDLSVIAESLQAMNSDTATRANDAGQANSKAGSSPPSSSPLVVQAMTIDTRAEVERCLDALCRYFEQYEPSHPAPLLLRRVQRLLALDFYEIMRDIAPDGLRQLDVLSGGSPGEHAGRNGAEK